MGVQARIVLYAPDSTMARSAAAAAFDRIAHLDGVMSDYRSDSELMQLCARAGQGPIRVSEDLFIVLDAAIDLARLSDGAFDVTVGPLVRLWRKARRAGSLPSSRDLQDAQARVGWELVTLDDRERTVALALPGMQLDLGGIAKGYAADEAVAAAREFGVGRILVEFGGDIVVGDPPPGSEGWEITVGDVGDGGDGGDVRDGVDGVDGVDVRDVRDVGDGGDVRDGDDMGDEDGLGGATIVLSNSAVSSSADTEQFVEIDGKRYSHVVDPRTGLGLTDRLAVTVVASRGIMSDALATTLSILGPEPGLELIERAYPSVRAYVRYLE